MSGYLLSPLAAQDLDDLWEFIARNNLDAADRILEEIYAAVQRLVRMPLIGHFRDDLADRSHRFWPVRDFLIIYHPETSPLEIVRILRGSRDIPSLL
jgi:plasmid stabilization system protein ParE